MPRGFLVKRSKHSVHASYRTKKDWEDERSDSGSETENIHTQFGSPDSGYSASPQHCPSESLAFNYLQYALGTKPGYMSSPTSLPITFPSPFTSSAFDRLTVSSTPEKPSSPAKSDSSGPGSPNKRRGTENLENKSKLQKKSKAVRKINFDIDKTSPVSGTIILDKSFSDNEDEGRVICGDIDSKYNCVEITPESRAELERIENKIGDYICQLCKEFFEDAFELAKHRCSRIIHIEYRCPECDKVFNCPANLASHRRWHKPRATNTDKKLATPALILPAPVTHNGSESNGIPAVASESAEGEKDNVSPIINLTDAHQRVQNTEEGQFPCESCGKRFRRQAYLRKHAQVHANDKPTPCRFCDKVLPSENACLKHEMQHSSTANKDITCFKCGSIFTNKVALEKHMRMHTGDVYTCKYCSSTFYSSPGLTRHINKCHPTENKQKSCAG